MNITVGNFDFLTSLDDQLANLGRLAESYFHHDPSTSLIKLRQFGERLSKRHVALVSVAFEGDDTQADILRRLNYERAAPEKVLDLLHHLRTSGNGAVHEGIGSDQEALACLGMAVQVAILHFRTST